jgi:hypothetical protein
VHKRGTVDHGGRCAVLCQQSSFASGDTKSASRGGVGWGGGGWGLFVVRGGVLSCVFTWGWSWRGLWRASGATADEEGKERRERRRNRALGKRKPGMELGDRRGASGGVIAGPEVGPTRGEEKKKGGGGTRGTVPAGGPAEWWRRGYSAVEARLVRSLARPGARTLARDSQRHPPTHLTSRTTHPTQHRRPFKRASIYGGARTSRQSFSCRPSSAQRYLVGLASLDRPDVPVGWRSFRAPHQEPWVLPVIVNRSTRAAWTVSNESTRSTHIAGWLNNGRDRASLGSPGRREEDLNLCRTTASGWRWSPRNTGVGERASSSSRNLILFRVYVMGVFFPIVPRGESGGGGGGGLARLWSTHQWAQCPRTTQKKERQETSGGLRCGPALPALDAPSGAVPSGFSCCSGAPPWPVRSDSRHSATRLTAVASCRGGGRLWALRHNSFNGSTSVVGRV